MRIAIAILLVSFFILSGRNTFAQLEEISKPFLELKNGQIDISYQILNSTSNDRYRIWIEVTNTNNETIKATALAGDHGNNVPGGGTRHIMWNYRSDRASIEEGVFIQVLGERMSNPISESGHAMTDPTAQYGEKNNISYAGLMLRSVAFPGWGLARETGARIHLLKGVAAYSGIVSALIFNNLACNSYEQYQNSLNENELNDLFNRSVRQDNISEVSAYLALGIWVTDIIWTLVGVNNSGDLSGMNNSRVRLDLGITHGSFIGVPVLALQIDLLPKRVY